MNKFLGIDAGSRFLKYAVISENEILKKGVIPSLGVDREFIKNLCETVDGIGLTGYGRSMFYEYLGTYPAEKLTEIKASARSLEFLGVPAGTILDIGGQDTKIINLDRNCKIEEFYMNDKCAAGTGKFIEMVLNTLGVEIEKFEDVDIQENHEITINSTCAVFAETEIIQLGYRGISKYEVLSAVFKSIASRAIVPYKNIIKDPLVFTGGAALFEPLKKWVEYFSRKRVTVPDEYRFSNAVGAANYAKQKNLYSKTAPLS